MGIAEVVEKGEVCGVRKAVYPSGKLPPLTKI